MGTDTTVNKLQVMALSPRHEKKKTGAQSLKKYKKHKSYPMWGA